MNTPYLLLLVAVFWVTIVVSQKNPPPLPTEYYCNVIQRKWNHNGYGVNHTESSTSYSSYSLGYYRFDTAAIESNFTATSGNVGNLASSLNDYTGKVFPTPIDTFVEISNVGQVPTCTVYNSTWPPPLPANGLSLLGAIYSGTREIPYYGQVDQWTVVENKAAATFWFSGGLIVGYQFDANNSDQGQVGVVTFMFNLVEGYVPSQVFDGSGGFPGCVHQLVPSTQIASSIFPRGVVPLHGFSKWVEMVSQE